MSADNYYTIKVNPDTFEFHVCHGFMSDLDDGVPSFIREGSTGYPDYTDALQEAASEWSEYGVIHEGALSDITNENQWRAYLEETIRTSQEHLNWLNGVYDD